MDNTNIQVVMIDVQTGLAFAETVSSLDSLPMTFALATTVYIQEQEWEVVKAEPSTSDEFALTGKVVITLQKVVRMARDRILFTLPSLNDFIPGSKNVDVSGQVIFRIHEDFWRQVEFVSSAHDAQIASEFDEVARIYRDYSVPSDQITGFKKCHVRKLITDPLIPSFSLADLCAILPKKMHQLDGLGYNDDGDKVIDGGFAFDMGSTVFYGQALEGRVKALGVLRGHHTLVSSGDLAAALTTLMSSYSVYLVDWCRVIQIQAEEASIKSHLESMYYQ